MIGTLNADDFLFCNKVALLELSKDLGLSLFCDEVALSELSEDLGSLMPEDDAYCCVSCSTTSSSSLVVPKKTKTICQRQRKIEKKYIHEHTCACLHPLEYLIADTLSHPNTLPTIGVTSGGTLLIQHAELTLD